MTDREYCLSGALLRAVILIRRGWMDSAIWGRLVRDYPEGSPNQIAMVIGLAHRGVDFADRNFSLGRTAPIVLATAPQLPQE